MFGDNLKKYRMQKGYSQSELAKKLYVSRQCISKWENDTTQPDLQTLTKLGEILDIPVDTLLKSESDAPKISRSNITLFAVNIAVALFCALAFISLYRYMPKTIPAHWSHGTIDRYGARSEILIHMITTLTFLSVDIAIFFAIKKIDNYITASILHGTIILFQAAYLAFIVALYSKLLTAPLSFVTCLTADIFLCLSIMMHPKLTRRNRIFGVRTVKTLQYESVWYKTNALACYCFSAVSAAILAVNLSIAVPLAYLCPLAYIIPAIAVLVYARYTKPAENE